MDHDVPDPAQAPPLAWGILGAGNIARRFATEIPAHTAGTVVAVGSRSQERADDFAATFDIPVAHGDYESLVADERVQAVYIASPHSEHRDHALLALAAGKPVLVEKAFTRSAAEAREVFAAADAAGLFAMEAMWSRFLPHMAALDRVLRSGEIGQVVTLTAHHGQWLDVAPSHRLKNPDLAGGAVLDLGVYPISFAHQVLGSPETVTAVGHLAETGVDATEAVVLTYPGVVASLTTTMLAGTRNDAVISGTAGRIEIAPTFFGSSTLTIHSTDGAVRTIEPPASAGFAYQAAETARCLEAGLTQSPVLPWEETLAVMRTMDEVRRQLGVVLPGEGAAP
ncbi:Gfo/Idh/MocA family protein [Pseudactinotalea sp. Z1739]|uniref:Gfo/Idh/MocA family protein n=1 Tax=Pseudactinotalea sp. Z1739 TaxID=3413028 RepID=UPI003C7B9859